MKKIKLVVSLLLIGCLVMNLSVPVRATGFSSSDVYNVLYQGFCASSSISEIEELLDGEASFDGAPVRRQRYSRVKLPT